MRRTKSFLVGALLGVVVCYQLVQWRIGAATAYAQVYAVAIAEMADQLQQCAAPTRWPRKRGPL